MWWNGRFLWLAVAVVLAPQVASAQRETQFEYAVKIVCGRPDGSQLAPGTYFTAVNVHNPEDTVALRFKVAATGPDMRPGQVSGFSSFTLGPDQAVEVDCAQAMRVVRTRGFLKGFLVLQTRTPVDVVAVYTASGRSEFVDVLDVERVAPRRMPTGGCPDLVVDSIAKPTWDAANNRTEIRAVIRNAGTAAAPPTLARVIDPTTTQTTGAPYNAVVWVPALDAGQSVAVVFYLPYWVYNPDVRLEVTADYKGNVAECDERNNTRVFEDIG